MTFIYIHTGKAKEKPLFGTKDMPRAAHEEDRDAEQKGKVCLITH